MRNLRKSPKIIPFLQVCRSIQLLAQKFHKNDFALVTDFMMKLRIGKKIHLCEYEANELSEALNLFFNRMIEVSRIKVGKRQTVEDAVQRRSLLLLGKFLKD